MEEAKSFGEGQIVQRSLFFACNAIDDIDEMFKTVYRLEADKSWSQSTWERLRPCCPPPPRIRLCTTSCGPVGSVRRFLLLKEMYTKVDGAAHTAGERQRSIKSHLKARVEVKQHLRVRIQLAAVTQVHREPETAHRHTTNYSRRTNIVRELHIKCAKLCRLKETTHL